MGADSTRSPSLFEAGVRIALAIVLASYVCVPSAALAAEGDSQPQPAAGQEVPDEGDAAGEANAGADADAAQGDAARDDTADESDAANDQGSGTDSEAFEADAEADADGATEVHGETSGPTDIAARWNAGSARIDEAGDYELTADVEADAPLKVALPEGASATIDLAGFSATVKADEGDVACAVDLSDNSGAVVFTDSAYDGKHPDERASIMLEADDPQGDVAAVSAVRSRGTRGASPEATFEHVRLAVEATAKSAESYEADAAAVKTGLDPKAVSDSADAWKAESETVVLAFAGCAFDVDVSVDDSPDALAAVEKASGRGSACAIDAGCRGVELDGCTDVTLSADGDAATDGRPMLMSAYDETYAIGPDLELGAADADGAAGTGEDSSAGASAFVLGFPSGLAAEGATEAVVAKAVQGEAIPQGADAWLAAPEGYEASFERVADDADGFAQMKLAKFAETDEGDAPAQSGAAAADASAARPADGAAAGQPAPAFTGLGGSRPSAYAKYVAANAGKVVYASDIKPLADGTDLNAAWKTQTGGTDSVFTISEGGTYYLSDDFAAGNELVIDAANKDVTLKFNGHALTIDGGGAASQKTMLSIVAAKSVTLDGAPESGATGASTLKSAGELDVWAINSTASGCALSANDLNVVLAAKSNAQRNLYTHAIRIESGSLALANCTVSMMMGNQALASSDLLAESDYIEPPSAIFATSDVMSVTLADCTVTGEGSQGFSLDDISNATAIGNAYALYSRAASTVVSGGTYKAVSLHGNATCLYGSSLEIVGSVSLEADAGRLATGILSDSAAGVTLDAPISFSVDDDYAGFAEAEAVLRTSVDGGFKFGDCAPSGSDVYTALVLKGNDLSSANASGDVIGALAGAQNDAVVAALANALGGKGCSVVSNMGYARFHFDGSSAANAVASVTDDSSVTTYFESLDAAIGGLANGGTLTLLADVGDIVISQVNAATLELGSHTARSLTFSTAGTAGAGLVVSGGTITGSATAVSHSSTSPLTLDGVKVNATATDKTSYGIYVAAAAGRLELRNSTKVISGSSCVSVASSPVAYGVYLAFDSSGAGPEVVVDGATVSAVGLTAGVAAYGIYNSVNATVTGSSISASTATSVAAAVYAGGTFSASSSSFDAFTSDVGTTASDLWMRTSSPVASSVSLDGCTFKVRSSMSSQDVAGLPYTCVLGATADTGTSVPTGTLTLSGANTFNNVGDAHLGMNVGNVALGSGFSLSGSSDSRLVISQAKNTDSIGVSVDGSLEAQMDALAGLFEAKSGSYYDGWTLQPDTAGHRLVWSAANGVNVVSVVHNGTETGYASLAAAIAASESGDTIRVLSSFAESGVHTISQGNLVLDLNGKTLTVRGGAAATAGSSNAGGALAYTGSGTLAVKSSSAGGSLDIQVGAAIEAASGATYQGIAVSGGGALSIDSGATVNVDYTGSTSTVAQQRDVVMRGVSVVAGEVDCKGVLSVTGAQSDNALGAMDVYGIFSQPTDSSTTSGDITIGAAAKVSVEVPTGAQTTLNNYYAESTSTQASPVGLREITVDPSLDADFYNDIVEKFRISAAYDDPTDSSLRDNVGCYVYYAQNMQLDHEGKWYDGLKVWAFSDEVASSAVGTAAAMTPSHVFVSDYYDVLPNAYGIASGPGTSGRVVASISGSVDADCTHGNAYAMSVSKAARGNVMWTCNGASVSAEADTEVHPVAQGSIDLRDFIDFKRTSQTSRVAYSNMLGSQLVAFDSPIARAITAGENVGLSLRGSMAFSTIGLDHASISVQSPTTFGVYGDFSLASGSDVCSVVDASGENEKGMSFARPVSGGSIDPSLFADARGTYTIGLKSNGYAYWASAADYTVTFKVGDAVVARYAEPTSIDLSEPSALAQRSCDQRRVYTLVGWSTSADENATSGYLGVAEIIAPTENAVYYAVYESGPVTVPVSFTNVAIDGSGTLQDRMVVDAKYGQTVGEALADAGKSLPVPVSEYTDVSGVKYHFVGWYPYSSSSATSALLYNSDQVKDLEITLALNGMATTDSLTLRATYMGSQDGQHVITFVVDDRTSSCLVDDGERPVYTAANSTNPNYTVPSKQVTEAGKTFMFAGWFVDSDGDCELDDGEPSYASVLPRADSDVTYVANWSWEWADVKLTFHIQHYDAETQVFDSDYTRVIDTTYEEKTQDVADTVEKVGNQFGFGGKIYKFRGWGVRATDADPVYDDENPLPDVEGSGMGNASYTKTYYGVYSISEHMVEATFMDGSNTLGTAKVSGLKTIDNAFSATGAREPADKSSTQQFLGWATDPSATTALDGVSTTLEGIESVGKTGESVTFYAVYGIASEYTVRLRDEAGTKVLYRFAVRKGKTVNAVAASKGVTITSPSKTGYYFTGWRTAAGAWYDLASSVQGTIDLYASYNAIPVTSGPGVADIDATVTSTLAKFEQVPSLSFTLSSRDSAEGLLTAIMSENGYTAMKSYDMRLVQTDSSGAQSVVTGDFGTAEIKIYIGSKYKNTTVRVFWVGVKDNTTTAMYSAAKTADSAGYITVSIGSYSFTDADEGGNLAVGYVEGGSSDSSLSKDSGTKLNSPGSALSSGAANLGSSPSSLPGSSLVGSLSSSLSGSLAGSSAAGAGSSDSALGNKSGAGASGGGSADGADGSGTDSEQAEAEGDTSFFADWNSDAIVLLLLCLGAVAAIVGGLWRLIVVRQRREEQEAELPVMSDQYARGIHF